MKDEVGPREHFQDRCSFQSVGWVQRRSTTGKEVAATRGLPLPSGQKDSLQKAPVCRPAELKASLPAGPNLPLCPCQCTHLAFLGPILGLWNPPAAVCWPAWTCVSSPGRSQSLRRVGKDDAARERVVICDIRVVATRRR